MKVIFGGTYDPVHLGHLRMATELRDALGVDQVHLMPCYQAVHKQSVGADAQQRLDMLNLSLNDDAGLFVDTREIARGQASYTIDSLIELKAELSDEPLCIVMGEDSVYGIADWKSVSQFSSLTHLVVLRRPGFDVADKMPNWESKLQSLGFAKAFTSNELEMNASGRYLTLDLTALEISSSFIRESVRQEKSIRYLVVDAVNEYICDNALYRN